jgi:hypothetical protein
LQRLDDADLSQWIKSDWNLLISEAAEEAHVLNDLLLLSLEYMAISLLVVIDFPTV